MKAHETNFYGSADNYVEGSEGMRNEVTLLYVAASLVLQETVRRNGPEMGYGGLGSNIFIDLRQRLPDVSVLDVCCGPGNVGNYLGLVVSRVKVIGIDKSADFIRHAQEKFGHLGWDFIVGDVRNFDLGVVFDFVTGSSAYHHIEDLHKVQFLRCIKKHLAPHGRAILCENFLPFYVDDSERTQAVNAYYQALKQYYRSGHGNEEALVAIDEVHQLELSGQEEHKVHFPMFQDHVSAAGLEIERIVGVWQPSHFAEQKVGSFVVSLRQIY